MTTARGRELQGEMRGANNFILLFICNHFVQGNTRMETTRYPEQYFSIVLLVLSKLARNSPSAPSGVCCSQARHIFPGRVNFEKLISRPRVGIQLLAAMTYIFPNFSFLLQ